MAHFKSYILMIALFVLASCAPIDQEQITISAPKAVTTKDAQIPDSKTPPTSDIQDTDNQTAAFDNQTLSAPKAAQAAPIAEDALLANDNETASIAEESAVTVVKVIPKIDPKITIAPKPIEPVNPVIFSGLTIQALEARLGRPDRVFNEQALDVWHYKESHCHALFFIQNKGDRFEVMHVDLRASVLQNQLKRQICFAEFGQRAEALLDTDKR